MVHNIAVLTKKALQKAKFRPQPSATFHGNPLSKVQGVTFENIQQQFLQKKPKSQMLKHSIISQTHFGFTKTIRKSKMPHFSAIAFHFGLMVFFHPVVALSISTWFTK